METKLSRPDGRAIIYLLVIIGITLIIYYPSFSHLLRGETYTYFLDTQGDTTVGPLITKWYNYGYSRMYAAGDVWLFRPLLYVTVGLEKALFGPNFTYWRIAAFCMHILAVLCLFRLLWKVRPGVVAFSLTLFFSTAFLVTNVILYEQIAPVLLYTALTLSALYYAYEGVRKSSKVRLFIGCGCALVACFIYETGLVFVILLAGYFWLERKRLGPSWKWWSLLSLSAILVYLLIYLPPRLLDPRPELGLEFGKKTSIEGLILGLYSTYLIAGTWITRGLFPMLYNLKPIELLRSFSLQIVPIFPVLTNILGWAIIGLVVLFLGWGARKWKSFIPQLLGDPFFILLTCMIGAYAASVSFFRVASHSLGNVLGTNFHTHIFLALVVVWICMVVSYKGFNCRAVQNGVVVVLVVLSCISAGKVLTLNQSLVTMEKPANAYLHQVEEFVELHQAEEDFSFYATATSPTQETLEINMNLRHLGTLRRTACYFTVPQVLYLEYWNGNNPKYSLVYSPETGELEVTGKEYESFTVGVFPDTQFYSSNAPDIYLQQAQWFVDNAERLNIQFVIHVGDVVNTASEETQWMAADAAHDVLDSASIPNLVVPGNHDYENLFVRDSTNFETYFNYTRYEDEDWYGGYYGEGSTSSWGTFTVSGQEYLVMGLEFVPRGKVVKWARGVLDANLDAVAILFTHAYMYGNGTRIDSSEDDYAGAGVVDFNDGEDLWAGLVRFYPNISMVVSGHVEGPVSYRTDYVDGQPVNQVLNNWQHQEGGQGWLAYYEFFPGKNKIIGTAYSPLLDEFGKDEEMSWEWEFRK